MNTVAQKPAPHHRKLRNFLLDARFQLKFTGYIVGVTVVVVALMGAFLWRTTATLFLETEVAVEARSRAADTSRDLGKATLNNELMAHMDDPEFAQKLEQKSAAIDREYQQEAQRISEAREQLVKRQKLTLIALVGGFLAFIIIIGLAGIVATHRIVGPLFRIRRIAREVTDGKLTPPSYGLRPGDELQDVFEAMADMVKALRSREEADLRRVAHALELAQKAGSPAELVAELRQLEAELKAKLG